MVHLRNQHQSLSEFPRASLGNVVPLGNNAVVRGLVAKGLVAKDLGLGLAAKGRAQAC